MIYFSVMRLDYEYHKGIEMLLSNYMTTGFPRISLIIITIIIIIVITIIPIIVAIIIVLFWRMLL